MDNHFKAMGKPYGHTKYSSLVTVPCGQHEFTPHIPLHILTLKAQIWPAPRLLLSGSKSHPERHLTATLSDHEKLPLPTKFQ